MNSSVLYLVPTSGNSPILNKEVRKTKSLSELRMVLETSSECLQSYRRNSVCNPVINDKTLLPSSTIEGLVGPFKTLQEAQAAANLFKIQSANSDLSVPVNFHKKIKTGPDVTMPENSSESVNDKLSSTSSKQVVLNKSMEILWTKQGHENNDVLIPQNFDEPKMQAISNKSVSSSILLPSAYNSKTKLESILSTKIQGTVDTKKQQEDTIKCLKESNANYSLKNTPASKKKAICPITKVTTLVFFDLETTGLAFQIGASNVQITEVSMIAINRKEFEQSTYDDLRDIRIIQKLCLCTKPRSEVSSGAADVTGLNNENLIHQNPFEHNTAEAINFFLSHLPKPVCLIAHNGNRYDFPLLKAEFSRLAMSLPSDILIADTLKAFRVLGVPVFPPEKKVCKSVKFTKSGKVSYSLSNLHLYFFNKNPTGSHSSEGDCIALAKVCHRMKDLMLLWIDENCNTFDCISPMW